MTPNPLLGLIFHWIGGLASASFYIPYRGVRKWAWESYWIVGGFFSWIVAPWLFAWLLVPHLGAILREAPGGAVGWSFLFGTLWGVGGLTFGLTMRYLGIALGMAIALGFCAAFGTLMPPLVAGDLGRIAHTVSGQWILSGVAVCLLGIGVSGCAGMSKESELSEEEKRRTIREFHFAKGLGMAVFSGVMSACMSYGFASGKPIAEIAAKHLAEDGAGPLWRNLPVLVVVLLGGFATNGVWCLVLNLRNRTWGDYISRRDGHGHDVPLLANYVFSAIAGVTWYLQFFFYSMGETCMGAYGFSSWTLHMASIIIFSTLWGIALREWKGTSFRTHLLIGLGLFALVGSTVIVGYGNYLGAAAKP
ncbi:L-rhamnose-H+ transport protein [Verrucomicrobium sp. GAS474]|uniref:L-rhamnose/proton symporter RhaT n=1 Tax=Verrucomicrobium sp. GAS474 TaxID=1882831 RepID=UPI00087DB24F|nr:L-rhamnose/proton symporter RhaT [Verrucomicrobium sp. GAS474]SDU27567.1 L-rhamnose-H+ transport protein [Verrucomicrobium sp. GAS474]